MAAGGRREDLLMPRKDAPREEWEPKGLPEPKGKGGMFPNAGQSREEWEPQQNPGIVSGMGNPRTTDEPDILKPVQADTRTQSLKKGGPVRKKMVKKPAWRKW
jgi:hypothetical protein